MRISETVPAGHDFMFRFWGRDARDVAGMLAVPFVEEDEGGGCYVSWFKTAEERDVFRKSTQGKCVVHDSNEGPDTHHNTTAKVVFKYRGQEYSFDWKFGYGYPASSARFMIEEGNYSCDCNRSIYIRQYADPSFEEMECGHEIKLLSLKVFKGDRDATDDDDTTPD
jgi:hypothetical protein